MGIGPSANGDESNLELFIESLGPQEAWETDSACGPSGSSAFDKLTTCNV
jgi:hypothetical protein